ncbi:MAG TPA: hypothetical protein VHS56_06065 [Candidatus Cybelea sp.]|nr:hypothetical protein [Candidatus Cybelea sp.]
MKPLTKFAAAAAISALLTAPAFAGDPGTIGAYVTPYYNSAGPVIKVGKFSSGLASQVPGQFVATIVRMKKQWGTLNFVELYVGAMRLYDLGYRNEATYWFYAAQFRGRQYAALVDRNKLGNVGSPGFELYHAQDAFFQLAGPSINGYAFGDVAVLQKIVAAVESQNRTVPDMSSMYPGVAFIHKAQWPQKNAELESGLAKLAEYLSTQKPQIAQERERNGTQARFAKLSSKRFPGGL